MQYDLIKQLIGYYEQDVQDYTDHLENDRDEHSDYYEGQLGQLILVIEDLKLLKKELQINDEKKTREK